MKLETRSVTAEYVPGVNSFYGHACRIFTVLRWNRFLEIQTDLVTGVDIDGHPTTVRQLAEQQLVGQRLADGVLDQTRHGAGAHHRVETMLGEMGLQRIGTYRLDFLLVQLFFQLHQELVHHLQDERLGQRRFCVIN